SVGHYENGDTLVVDTIGFNDRVIDNYRTPRTTQLHVIERWKIAPDGNAVDISVTVEDPGVFTTPWRAMHRWRRVQQPFVEYMRRKQQQPYYRFQTRTHAPSDQTGFLILIETRVVIPDGASAPIRDLGSIGKDRKSEFAS